MWGSSDESDVPQNFQASCKPTTKSTSNPKPSRPKPSTSARGQSKYCVGNSDSSVDSDSSAEEVQKHSAKGHFPAQTSHAPKPKPRSSLLENKGDKHTSLHGSKGDKQSSLAQSKGDKQLSLPESKGDKRSSLTQSKGDKLSLPESKADDWPALGKENNPSRKMNLLPKTQPDAKRNQGPVTGERPTRGDSHHGFAEEYPSLHAASRDISRSSPMGTRPAQGLPGNPKTFQKLTVKESDSDRGMRYSKREEKLNLNDFMPQKLKDKSSKKTHSKQRGGYFRDLQSDGSAHGMNLSDIAKGFQREDSQSSSASAVEKFAAARGYSETGASSKPSHHSPFVPEKEASGRKKPKSRKQAEKNSSGTDDSSDESFTDLLMSQPRYIPPPRRHGATGRVGDIHSDERRAERPHHRGSGFIPRIPEGMWPRGQTPGEQPKRAMFPRGDEPRRAMFDRGEEPGKGGFDRGGEPRRGAIDRGEEPRTSRRGEEPRREEEPRRGAFDRRENVGGNDRRREQANRYYFRDDGNQQHNDGNLRGMPNPRNDNAPRHNQGRRREEANEHRGPPPPDEGARGPPRGQDDRAGGNRQPYRPHPAGMRPLEANLTFHRLRELKPKPPAEVVAALSYSKEGLSKLLKNEDKLSTDPALMRLLLSALAKTCQCNSMPSQRNEILNYVRVSSFLRLLGAYLTTSAMQSQDLEISAIIGDCAELCKALVTIFSTCLMDVVMVHGFMDMAQKQIKLRGVGELPGDVTQKLEQLDIAQDAAMVGMQQKESRKSGVMDEDSQTPPDDFRQISVFPTMDDLNKEELPFLRKNKERGGYTGLDHYLDVQFRLLREDFVYPLREGIAEYLEMVRAPQRNRRLKDIRLYHNVHIVRAVCLSSSLGHRLSFDVSRMKRVRWEVSKRLIFGSLVCLSADNFQTLFFATVTNREPADLKEGLVDVSFEHNLDEIAAIPPETMFIMAETTAFFEAYRHVLSGLQNIQGNQLPFQKYIIRCEKMVSEPRYLTDKNTTVKYDLRPLVDDKMKIREDRKLLDQQRDVAYAFSSESQPADDIPILQREDWPDPRLLRLDESQYEALNRALTKEFSVIQGPPGTGKTYVGLKIVKALLHNRKTWDPDHSSCMLIVCFTNHALDQFLEGVVSFFDGRVVRVGSRLRSEKLEPFSLSNLRWNMRRQRDDVDRDFREITRLRFQGHNAMDDLKKEVDTMGLKIESAKREILHEDVLMPYMLDRHYDRLVDAREYLEMQGHFVKQGKTKKKVFCVPEWLGIGAVLQNALVTAHDLQRLDQELGGEDDLDIEGEVQALEEQNRLDTDDTGTRNEKQKKDKEKKRALAQERSTYLAVDISRLDQGADNQDQGGKGGGGGAFHIPKGQWKKLKRKLRRNVELDDRMSDAEERQVHDVWMLDMPQRWRLYRRWTHNLCQALKMNMSERERLYDEFARRQQETLMQEDKYILKTASVIAMTTTAAARYQSILQEVKPKVIVVEEAAEVLEGHVITTLSQECQHLILIGDHKQLRPNPTVYALARKYNLELSLFERMINNGLRCMTLGWQHRMRPEIAELVRPIYPTLNNHASVETYEPIKGVTSNLFFITHNEPEAHDDETKSHSNLYEAEYVTRLCAYLLKQGYHPSRITVLTTYSGQLFHLKRLMPKKSIFDGVRVTVVDNFQGEENDIILLSLVRSNDDGNIGFLKIENRVCVALSRAKMGMYVIGNFDLLSAESNLWHSITTDLGRQGRLGETLSLYCQNHPKDRGLVIRGLQDFDFAPEGGCMKPCNARLDCGHVCMRLCHPYDREHEEYKCIKKCERKMACEFGHACKKLCHQDCGDCEVMVERVMRRCGHRQWMKCHEDPEEFVCKEECLQRLICGHKCGDVCGERHRCYEKVQHTWPCGHTAEVYCFDKESIPCTHPCEKVLSCGHPCSGNCKKCHGGRLHRQCTNDCTKILVCGHACRDACSNCPPCSHTCQNSCVHSSCPKRCGLKCAPCMEPCVWQCPHHRCQKLCSEPCDRPRCDEACPKLLPCNHPCIGVCGEPCPQLCRTCHADQVTEIFFGTEDEPDARFVELEDCLHVLEVSGLDQWMTTMTDQHEDSIQLKACPKCRTTIRRNLRYGAIIRTQLNDIENIKGKMLGDEDKRQDTQLELELMIEDETDLDLQSRKQEILQQGDQDSLGGLVAMLNQMKFLEEVKKLKLLRKKKAVDLHNFSDAVVLFEMWVCKRRQIFSEQELDDAQRETKRLRHWLMLLVYKTKAASRGIQLPDKLADPLNNMLLRMKEGRPHGDEHQQMTSDLLKQLEELVPESGLGVSEEERVMIVTAMGLNQGHWFKCPRGHIYAIGDCGGATEESRCPECNASIGGTQHRLRDDNELAREMDGAARPAWPTALDQLVQDFLPDDEDLFG